MREKRILVTGANGFIGSHLIKFLINAFPDAMISGIGRDVLPEDPLIRSVDLTDTPKIIKTISSLKPDYIFHMAGRVHSADLNELYIGNVGITINILEAILRSGHSCRIVVPGSAAEYGQIQPQDLPITEDHQLRPISLYGVVKSWQTIAAVYYASQGVNVVIGRVFNVIGPGMSKELALGAFIDQLEHMKKDEGSLEMDVGNLSSKRDFIDIDDVLRALVALALNGGCGQIYNICSGVSVSMANVLDRLIQRSGLAVELTVNKERVKTADITESRGSYLKLKELTGWEPVVSLNETIEKLMNM